MAADSTFVELHLEAGEDADAREIDQLTTKLRRELMQLDVDSVERPAEGEAPPGSKGADVVALGTLVVGLAKSSDTIKSIISSVRDWLSRQREPERSVEINIGGDTIVVKGISSTQQESLIAAWIDRNSE
jgi:hypothetical protein